MDLDSIVEAISAMSGPELERVREAVDSQRERLAQSTVVERRSHGSGVLQLEYRANPKTGTTRGPNWYFHYREGGPPANPLRGQDRRSGGDSGQEACS